MTDVVAKPCRYDVLATTLAHLLGGSVDQPPRPCTRAATHYVSIVHRGRDWSVEMLQNLCPDHERPAQRVDGWQWSRPVRGMPLQQH